ncbi:MAG: chromate efflux transporter [Granulosicoccus sp.]|nr:chromate efflux transporter [Granulosicoccus sp.]
MNNTKPEAGLRGAPTQREAFAVWLKIGLLSFGGPAAQIALMHKYVVEENRWLSEKQFLSALSFCMLLPGPEAMQLATYAGWRIHGVAGGLVAGLLFVIPGALIVLALGSAYVIFGEFGWFNALFLGIKAAVIIVVVEALLRVSKRALGSVEHWVIAGLAFCAIFFLNLPFPLIIALAAVFGFFRLREKTEASHGETTSTHGLPQQQLYGTLLTVISWLALWAAPLLLLYLAGLSGFLLDLGVFFSKLAVVTFGGAYAVLAYLAQDVVSIKGWLSAGEMMDGLGLAETTPGPLILVTEFVGFLAGFREGGFALGFLAAVVTLWVTFVPCFLWIFAGAPYIEWIGQQPRLKMALSAITAAVVGVILNLSVWFALHVMFTEVAVTRYGWLTLWWPTLASVDWLVLGLTLFCAVAVFRWHWNIVKVLIISALLGLIPLSI